MKPIMRRATLEDVSTIVRLVNAGGPDGRPKEELPADLPNHYRETFAGLAQDPNVHLMVAELDGQIIGTLRLNFITYLAGKGKDDAQIEAVHVAEKYRNRGVGHFMMTWAIEQARKHGCRRVQLTTNKRRLDAHRFYKRLGFEASHEGMKLSLD